MVPEAFAFLILPLLGIIQSHLYHWNSAFLFLFFYFKRFHHSTVYNSQDMEATQMSINRQMDKKPVVHIHNGVLLSH